MNELEIEIHELYFNKIWDDLVVYIHQNCIPGCDVKKVMDYVIDKGIKK